MSYRTYFSLSSGLSRPIRVPKGTLKKILDHIRTVESSLGYEQEQYRDDIRWKSTEPKEGVTDKILCNVAEMHNSFIRRLYKLFYDCSEKPPKEYETISPEQAKTFWHGLRMIDVPPARWIRDYYISRMETLYSVMRGEETEGILFDAEALTTVQSAAVIRLFSEYLDTHDVRLDVPFGHDRLLASDDGGYVSCEGCGELVAGDDDECRKCGSLI